MAGKSVRWLRSIPSTKPDIRRSRSPIQKKNHSIRATFHTAWAVAGVAVAAAGIGSRQAAADTLEWALVQAYQNNPSLNAQRAALRATDENVPQALSGYRPKLSVTANGGAEYQKSTSEFVI